MQPSPLTAILLKDLCQLAKHAYLQGWTPATAGNFSIKESDRIVWMSPSGKDKGNLQANQFIAVDLQSKRRCTLRVQGFRRNTAALRYLRTR